MRLRDNEVLPSLDNPQSQYTVTEVAPSPTSTEGRKMRVVILGTTALDQIPARQGL